MFEPEVAAKRPVGWCNLWDMEKSECNVWCPGLWPIGSCRLKTHTRRTCGCVCPLDESKTTEKKKAERAQADKNESSILKEQRVAGISRRMELSAHKTGSGD